MAVDRDTFGATELAICLSHYDIGVISVIKEFPRGSRRAPKVVIESSKGRYLFKRRMPGRDDIRKVAFSHQVQLHLAGEGFPLPHLIGTRPENNSLLLLNNQIYELFEYVEGGPYDGSLDATFESGRILGLYHKLLAEFQSDYAVPRGSYHDAKAIFEAIGNTATSLPIEDRPDPATLMATVDYLRQAYPAAADRCKQEGLDDWPAQIVHGDWHPGNMLFRDRHVVAVIDYDSSRMQQRVIDLANGALQFSIVGGGEDPAKWPDYMDKTRLKRFLTGYDSVNVISKAELAIVPQLMCEAMIAEAVLPIAATGSFGRMSGFGFMQMIQRKVQWVLAHMKEIEETLAD